MFQKPAKDKHKVVGDEKLEPHVNVVIVPGEEARPESQTTQSSSVSVRDKVATSLRLDAWWHEDNARTVFVAGLIVLALPVCTYAYSIGLRLLFPETAIFVRWRHLLSIGHPEYVPLEIAGIFWVIYFAPSLVALSRGACDQGKLLIANFVTGWTIIGWWLCFKGSLHGRQELDASSTVIRYGILVAAGIALGHLVLRLIHQPILEMAWEQWAEAIMVSQWVCTNFYIHSRNRDAKGPDVPNGWHGFAGSMVPSLFVVIAIPLFLPGGYFASFQILEPRFLFIRMQFFDRINFFSTLIYICLSLLVTYRLSAAIDRQPTMGSFRTFLRRISPPLGLMICVILVNYRKLGHPSDAYIASFMFAYWRLAALRGISWSAILGLRK